MKPFAFDCESADRFQPKAKFCAKCGAVNLRCKKDGNVRDFCPECGAIHYENPTPAACCVCLVDGQLLLVKRAVEPQLGMWCLPGGFIEVGETPEVAVLRELREETGLSGKISSELGHCSHFQSMFGDVLLIGFFIEIDDISKTQAGDDAADIGLFPFEKLPEIAFECHVEFIKRARSSHAGTNRN